MGRGGTDARVPLGRLPIFSTRADCVPKSGPERPPKGSHGAPRHAQRSLQEAPETTPEMPPEEPMRPPTTQARWRVASNATRSAAPC
eukprot:6661983-Pyramimonas_sp.AAC.1